jgi:hypothetical protein
VSDDLPTLYAEMVRAHFGRLQPGRRTTKRERALELFLLAALRHLAADPTGSAPGGVLRLPREVVFAADRGRRGGQRVDHDYDDATDDHVIAIATPPAAPTLPGTEP